MKINRAYRKILQVKFIVTEFLWDLIEKIPIIGGDIIQDFYPFDGGPRFKLLNVIKYPKIYLIHSSVCNKLEDKYKSNIIPIIESIQKIIIGKKYFNILMWLIHCNSSKLLSHTGWDCDVRSHGDPIKYFNIRIFPFGYIRIVEKVYLDINTNQSINMFKRNLMSFISDKAPNGVKEVQKIVFSGWVHSVSDLLRMSHAYNMAYEGERNIWEVTKEGRKFIKEYKELNN